MSNAQKAAQEKTLEELTKLRDGMQKSLETKKALNRTGHLDGRIETIQGYIKEIEEAIEIKKQS